MPQRSKALAASRSSPSAKPFLSDNTALFLKQPPVQLALRATDIAAQIGDSGITWSLSHLLVNTDTLAALLLLTAPCLEGLFAPCQQETPVLQGGAEHSACAMLLLHIADSNRAAAHSMPGSQQRSSFAHSPWLSSVLSQQQPATVMSARAHLHHQYSATAAATGLDPGQESSCPWLSGRWILAARGAAALRAALCTVPMKEAMEVAEILPEVTWSWTITALSCDIMGWANTSMQEQQLQATEGPCLPHAPLLHAQLLASQSFWACAFLTLDDSVQLVHSLRQKCLDIFLRAVPPIADAALLAWPSAAVLSSTPELLVDFRGLISSCVRSLSDLLTLNNLHLGAMHAVGHAAALLQHLHLGLPCPVSDPAPALRLPAGASQYRNEGQRYSGRGRGSARARRVSRSSSSCCPTRYMQGHLWDPDTSLLGPSDLTGLLFALQQHLIVNMPCLTAEACLTSLTIITSMIPLATAMTEEAAQPKFRAQLTADAATFQAFCHTCTQMLTAACDALFVVCEVERMQSQQSTCSGAGEQQGGQGPGVQAGVASVSTASEIGINPVAGQDTASLSRHTGLGPSLVHPEGSAGASATLHPLPCSLPSAIIKQDTAIGGRCSVQPCDSARVKTASTLAPSNAPDVACQAQGQVPVSCGLDHSSAEASASNPPASGTVPVKDDQSCELIRNDGAQETLSAASNDEAGEQRILDAPAQCTPQAAFLLPVLAASALQLIHLTSTCAWHALEAIKAPECQHLLSASEPATWSLARMEVALVRCIKCLLELGQAACRIDTSPDAAAVSTTCTSQQQPLASHQVCRQQGYPPDGDQLACDAVAGPISTQQESGSASGQVDRDACPPSTSIMLDKACQVQTCEPPLTEQRPVTNSSHSYTPGSVFEQLLPSLGRQCVGVCIASHLSEVCGSVLATLLAASSAEAPRPSAAAGAGACQQSATSVVIGQKQGDCIDTQDLLQLKEAMTCLSYIMYCVQGDLQSWMGPALGAHIRYDTQQLWISLGPLLSWNISTAQAGANVDLGGIYGICATVLPVMILAFKAAHDQPAGGVHLASSEAASTSPSSSGQSRQGGGQRPHGRGRADNASSSSSSSSSAATTNTTAAALPVPASSRKSGKQVAGRSNRLRERLWETLNGRTPVLEGLLALADCAPDSCLSTCLEQMYEVCIDQVSPPGDVCERSGTLGLLTQRSEGGWASAPDASPADSLSQLLTSALDMLRSTTASQTLAVSSAVDILKRVADPLLKVISDHLHPQLREVVKGGGPGRWWRAHAKQLAKYTQSQAQAAAGQLDPCDAAKMWKALGLAQSPA